MKEAARPWVLAYAGVALVTGSALSAEIAFTRIFSITLWHHFTYLVIGLALLGFGAAGARLAARGGAVLPWDPPLPVLLARRTRMAAVGTFAAIAFSGAVRCDTLRVFEEPASNIAALLLLVVLATLPFLGAGAVISTALAAFESRAGGVYAADLLGAGLGAALAPAAIGRLGGPGMIFVAAAATAAASLAFAFRAGRAEVAKSLALTVMLGFAAKTLRDDDPWVHPAPSKEIYAFDVGSPPSAGKVRNVEVRRWTPLGRIDVSGEVLVPPMMGGEFGTGASTAWHARGLTQDGAAPTLLYRWSGKPGELTFLPHASTAAVWEARATRVDAPPAKVLVIGVGGGIDVVMALEKGAGQVVGVDVNPATVSLLTGRYREYTGNLPGRPGVRLACAEGRAFVRSTAETFDVIQMSGVDTYAALASGAYSVAEAYLYTVEAFEDYLARLKPGGFVSVSRFILEPPRETLRLAGIAAEALRRRDVAEPWRHVAILRGTLWASLLVGERAFEEAELEALRAFAARESYRLAFDPGRASGQGPFEVLLRGNARERESLLASYPYDVRPVGDDSPFFFNYFRWRNLPSVLGVRRTDLVYTLAVPVGHFILFATFLATALLGAAGILLPMRRSEARDAARGPFAFYFASLGLAYLFVEIAFLQKLTFFLGHPTYALSLVLAGMLLASGAGAAFSRRTAQSASHLLRLLPLLLLLAGIVCRFGLPRLLGLPFTGRVLVALAILVPPAFLMGMPFPNGIERLRARRPEAIPWAFGVNAFATVVASTLSTAIAMEAGLTLLFFLAALLYAAALAALRRA